MMSKPILILVMALMVLGSVFFCHAPLFAKGSNTPETFQIGSSINSFGFEFYKHVRNEETNLVFSPSSIFIGLSMTCLGARGDTRVQMQDVLHIKPVGDLIHPGLAAIYRMLGNADGEKGYKLLLANALWMERQYSFLDDFLDLAKSHYDAALDRLDFRNSSRVAVSRINGWVEEKTEGQIRDLIDPKALNTSTRLVLTNAVFFKGLWENPFDFNRTRDSSFFLSDDETVSVPMMFQKAEFWYLEESTFQVLEMPYAGGDLSMMLILPGEVSGLPEIESMLNRDSFDSCKSRLISKEVEVYLPKFQFNKPDTLSRTLKEMGMIDAFNRSADFSGISGTRHLIIGEVFHSAYVEVNEQGTEASAGTGVVMTPGGIGPAMPSVVFKADHPFLFLIIHKASDAILFMGRVVSP